MLRLALTAIAPMRGRQLLRTALIALVAFALVLPIHSPSLAASRIHDLSKQRRAIPWSHLPISFVPNEGQWHRRLLFAAHTAGYTLGLTARGMEFSVPVPDAVTDHRPVFRTAFRWSAVHVDITLVGTHVPHPVLMGQQRLPGRVNYFLGNDRRQWRSGLPSYAEVRYHTVYPGTDLLYDGRSGGLEYSWLLSPHAGTSNIRWRVDGADAVYLDTQGNLHVRIGTTNLVQDKPLMFQDVQGVRRRVAGGFVLLPHHSVGFTAHGYDRHRSLVIDPTLSFATYLGGSLSDVGLGIAVDDRGSVYVAGTTQSEDFPTVHPIRPDDSAHDSLLFVSKLNQTGTQLEYSTYLGGTETIVGTPGGSEGLAIAVDGTGAAYLTGNTDTIDYPMVNALQSANRSQCFVGSAPTPCNDAIVTKLVPGGAALAYSTYLGGDGGDIGQGIAVDQIGSAYVTGVTDSTDFPTVHPFQARRGGDLCTDVKGHQAPCRAAFIAKLAPAGSSLLYSTYLGGTDESVGNGIAVDSQGNAMVAGDTTSDDFPLAHPIQSQNAGGDDAFVSIFNSSGEGLLLSTYLGGSDADIAINIAAGPDGSAYITGLTHSSDFPLSHAFQSTAHGSDAFVARVARPGTLVYSTYLGGSAGQDGFGIAVDGRSQAWVTGDTSSRDFPVVNPIQATLNGELNAFVSHFSSAGGLIFSTYLGGGRMDAAHAIALNSCGDPFVAGSTQSPDFPVVHSLQDLKGGDDAFIAGLTNSQECLPPSRATPIPTPSPTSLPTMTPTATPRPTPSASAVRKPPKPVKKRCRHGYHRVRGKCVKSRGH